MRRTMLTITMTATFAAIFATTAHADTRTYVEAMTGFEPVVTAWHLEFTATAEFVALKPILACDAEVADLARRGRSIARDLEGTNVAAPRSLSDIHGAIQGATDWMATVTEQACGGEYQMLADTAPEREAAQNALVHLRTWLAYNQPQIHELPILRKDEVGRMKY